MVTVLDLATKPSLNVLRCAVRRCIALHCTALHIIHIGKRGSVVNFAMKIITISMLWIRFWIDLNLHISSNLHISYPISFILLIISFNVPWIEMAVTASNAKLSITNGVGLHCCHEPWLIAKGYTRAQPVWKWYAVESWFHGISFSNRLCFRVSLIKCRTLHDYLFIILMFFLSFSKLLIVLWMTEMHHVCWPNGTSTATVRCA